MEQVLRYRNRISGPLLDRVDIQIGVPALAPDELQRSGSGEASATVLRRVDAARARMLTRQGRPNALLESREVEEHCTPDAAGMALLQRAVTRRGMSARTYHRTLKVARSIADLAGTDDIGSGHVAEALGYRRPR